MRKIFLLMTSILCAGNVQAQIFEEEVTLIATELQDEIVSVAKRTDTQIRTQYPAAIDVFDTPKIEEISAVHPAELLNKSAGVHIHRGSGLEHLTSLRSPVLTGGAGAGSFLYLQDGIPLRAAGFANVNGLFEAQSEFAEAVEVFKGPGSVLYGSNALHGLINIRSRPPFGDKRRYKITAGEDGYISGAFSSSWDEVIATIVLATDNGFRENSGYDQQKLSLSMADQYLGSGWGFNWHLSLSNLNQETAGFIRGDDAYLDDDVRFTNPNPEAYRDAQSARTHLRLEKDNLVIMPFARWTDMEFLRHFVPGQATEKVGHWSIGALNTWYGDNLILGFDAEFTQGYLDEFQAGPNRFSFVQGEHYDYEVDAITLAGYGEYDLALGNKTELSFGARAEYVDYSYDNKIDTADVGRFRRVDDRSDNFFIVTPKLALTHRLTGNLNLYGRAVRGARAPQVTDLYSLQTQQQPGEINSETLDSLEAGLKYKAGDLNLELAAYAMEKDNFFFRNSAGLNVVNGKTSHLGLEASARWQAADWLELSGNINFADHTYNFSDAASSASNTITDGDKVDTAPEIFGTGMIKLIPFEAFSAELEWRHLGEYFLDPGNTQTYPGHDVFVLRGQYAFAEDHTIFARVDNLFDKRYANRADFAFGSERYFPGRPRTLFVGLRGEF